MGRIKNWKKSNKYDGTNPNRLTIWFNTLPQYKSFQDKFYITVSGRAKDYSVSITKNGKQKQFTKEFDNGFESYNEAVKFATKYMREHPNG